MSEGHLSRKPIPPEERLIFALDVESREQAEAFVRDLGDSVLFYKVGLQLFMAGDYVNFAADLIERGKRVFLDLKMFDIPETVGLAVRQLKDRGVTFASVHGNDRMLEAAVGERDGTKILAVTVLTSLDQGDLEDLGFQVSVEELVLSRARRAVEIGCDGVISSGIEAPQLRQQYGDAFLIVSPGIRPVENRAPDDQKRTVDVETAFRNGADYIVVGRPIRDAPDPRRAAEQFQDRIRQLFT